MLLRYQKGTQIGLAILFTGVFFLLLPGVGEIGIPVGCLYIFWAVRASFDHRVSAWLAFVFTLLLAAMNGQAIVRRVSSSHSGLAISWPDFSIELVQFLVAASIVVLHAINWRWLLSPKRITQ